jgi:3D (Asp-Asp-Asp) domain-containing protein
MKTSVLIFASTLLLASLAFAREQSVLARITVYWAGGGGGSDANTRAHKCATGERLRAGHCAVDPEKIAYGSKIVFPDATCTAVDTGRDVINRKAARRCGRNATERSALVIDRFFETKRQAIRWAEEHPHFMTVRIFSPSEQSLHSRRARIMAEQTSPPNAQRNSPIRAQQGAAIVDRNNVTSELVDSPPRKLVADDVNWAGSFLPHRF